MSGGGTVTRVTPLKCDVWEDLGGRLRCFVVMPHGSRERADWRAAHDAIREWSGIGRPFAIRQYHPARVSMFRDGRAVTSWWSVVES